MRWLPGYEASQVNFKGEVPMGFALFSNHQFAIGAKDALQVFFHYTFMEIISRHKRLNFAWIHSWMDLGFVF